MRACYTQTLLREKMYGYSKKKFNENKSWGKIYGYSKRKFKNQEIKVEDGVNLRAGLQSN